MATTKRPIVIVGTEGSPRSVKAMKDPARLIEASPATDPFLLAERAVRLGVAIRRGEHAAGTTELMPLRRTDARSVKIIQFAAKGVQAMGN